MVGCDEMSSRGLRTKAHHINNDFITHTHTLTHSNIVNSDESPVAEIEQTEMSPIESPVEVTHEEISQINDVSVTNESQPHTNEIEETNSNNVPQEPEVEVEPTETVTQQKRRRKGKNYEEDATIDEAYASQLDLSCVGETAISAPNVDNAFISKYNR